MWSTEVEEDEPILELHVEVLMGLMGRKRVLEEKVIVDDSPEPFYFPIRLGPANSRIFVDNGELLEHDLKAVQMPRFLMVGGKFKPVVREEFLDRYTFPEEPFVSPFHEGGKGFNPLVREYFRIGDSRGIIDYSGPVFLFLRILPFDILLLVDVDMDEFSCHFLLVANTRALPRRTWGTGSRRS